MVKIVVRVVQVYGGKIQHCPSYSASNLCPFSGSTLPRILARVRESDAGAAQVPSAVGVPLSECALSFSAKDLERLSKSKGTQSKRHTYICTSVHMYLYIS